MKEKKSLSRTLLERKTPEEISSQYGQEGLLLVLLKSLLRHDSDRHLRKRDRSERAERRKSKNQKSGD